MNKFEYFKKKYPDLVTDNCISLYSVGHHIQQLEVMIKINILDKSIFDEFISDFNNANIEYSRNKILEDLLG